MRKLDDLSVVFLGFALVLSALEISYIGINSYFSDDIYGHS